MDRKEIQKEILEVEGYDIKDEMLRERRDWILSQQAEHPKGMPPDPEKFHDLYYSRTVVDPALAPPEEVEAAPADAGKKGKKDAKKAGKKKGKGGGGDAAEGDAAGGFRAKVGPTELTDKFDKFYEEYTVRWSNRDETDNHDQRYDRSMAREEIKPLVEKQLEEQVDTMIKQELANMIQLGGFAKKKKGKRGKKGGKKGKGKKKKPIKLPGGKQIAPFSDYDLLCQLVQNKICKYLPPAAITDFIGEYNYIHSMLDKTLEKNTNPSMALIRQLVTENIIFPLGSELLRKRHPEKIASVLFYGPEGTGKTLMVRAIASETKSIVFDLSPAATMDVYCGGRTDADKLVASVMKCAEVYQPAVVYIDECEKVWAAKKKKKKGQKGGGRGGKNDLSNPSRYKKTLGKWKAKWINDDTRITIIGCSSEVHECSRAEVKKFFDKSVYFPYPDYTTSCRMWKVFIENLSGQPLKTDFPLNTLAHMSIGYSAGAIRKAAEFVLTKFRKSKLD